jgi:CBS domain-containing protein
MQTVGLETLITYNPTAVTPQTPLADALHRMGQYVLRHLPVVDDERKLVGIISDFDARVALDGDAARKAAAPWAGGAGSQTVADVMTHSPVVARATDSPQVALRAMLGGGFHSVPVVDQQRLIGIVTSTDFLREFSYGEMPACHDLVSRHMHDHESQIESDASLDETARLLDELQLDYLAVVKGGCPIGVVSRRALRIAQGGGGDQGGGDPAENRATVARLANTSTPVVRPTDRLMDAAGRMFETTAGAASVVDRANRLVGLLTEDDILKAIAVADEP